MRLQAAAAALLLFGSLIDVVRHVVAIASDIGSEGVAENERVDVQRSNENTQANHATAAESYNGWGCPVTRAACQTHQEQHSCAWNHGQCFPIIQTEALKPMPNNTHAGRSVNGCPVTFNDCFMSRTCAWLPAANKCVRLIDINKIETYHRRRGHRIVVLPAVTPKVRIPVRVKRNPLRVRGISKTLGISTKTLSRLAEEVSEIEGMLKLTGSKASKIEETEKAVRLNEKTDSKTARNPFAVVPDAVVPDTVSSDTLARLGEEVAEIEGMMGVKGKRVKTSLLDVDHGRRKAKSSRKQRKRKSKSGGGRRKSKARKAKDSKKIAALKKQLAQAKSLLTKTHSSNPSFDSLMKQIADITNLVNSQGSRLQRPCNCVPNFCACNKGTPKESRTGRPRKAKEGTKAPKAHPRKAIKAIKKKAEKAKKKKKAALKKVEEKAKVVKAKEVAKMQKDIGKIKVLETKVKVAKATALASDAAVKAKKKITKKSTKIKVSAAILKQLNHVRKMRAKYLKLYNKTEDFQSKKHLVRMKRYKKELDSIYAMAKKKKKSGK